MEQMMEERKAFVVQILSRENATWQGTVTWLDGKKTQPFRSALELLRLMESAVTTSERGREAEVRDDGGRACTLEEGTPEADQIAVSAIDP